MNILGISGLDRAVSARKEIFPTLQRQELRITQGFDSAAALVGPGGIVGACAEERFCETKGVERFPIQSIRALLAEGAIQTEDLDFVAHAFDYEKVRSDFQGSVPAQLLFDLVLSRTAQLEVLNHYLGNGPWTEKLVAVPHHVAHAASAYLPSGIEDALILVSDGMGESESATIAVGTGGKIQTLATVSHRNSLGVLYGLLTMHLGFRFNSGEYKVMGLAPYGDPKRYMTSMSNLVKLTEDGLYYIPILQVNEAELDRQAYRSTLSELEELFGPAREPDHELTQRHMDIAASLQVVLQNTLLHTLTTFRQRTGATNLCMAGGVALNCSANGAIWRSRLFKRVFVQPAAGDDGSALGAALFVQHERGEQEAARRPMTMPMWGTHANTDEIRIALEAHGLTFEHWADPEGLVDRSADLLAQGKVIGWFQGRMEFGPRALGNRSILADPTRPEIRSRVNALVKKREDFRPFAPAVLASRAPEFFEIDESDVDTFRHMLFVTHVRARFRERLPAVTHCDGSARVQTVSESDAPLFHRLLHAFDRRAGFPIVLNTSFNVRGQPIVRTAAQAVATFREAGLDALVIGPYLVSADQSQSQVGRT